MDMLIAILLWLQCIVPHQVYTTSNINNLADANSQVILDIYQSQPQSETIWQVYGPVVPTIEVVDH